MSAELRTDEGAARPQNAPVTAPSTVREHRRPNVSGDLPTVLETAPQFRRAVVGYDRFEVDTYVQWAEQELATADRAQEQLLAQHLSTKAALDEAQQMLAHSAEGAELLRASGRIGALLATAADEAAGIRALAEAHRSTASAAAERLVAEGERALADARAQAGRVLAEAATQAAEVIADAGRIVDEAEQAGREAHAEAAARLEKVQAIEQRALEQAAQIRQRAEAQATAALSQARDEVIRILTTGREERRRADGEAAAARDRLDREAAARRAALLAEIDELEHRRAVLSAEPDRLQRPLPTASVAPSQSLPVPLARMRDRLHGRLRPAR